MTSDLGVLTTELRAAPLAAALLFDFDGTLSPVVADPAAATPAPGVVEVLAQLSRQYRTVGVVSGRPVEFLAALLPSGLALSGLYGLESMLDGELVANPAAEQWRPVVARVAEQAMEASAEGEPLAGMLVEAKGLSITLHTRTRPDLGPSASVLAATLAAQAGLECRGAKQSVELHPPVDVDKGTALDALAGGADRVLYVGDDLGDLPAFDAVARGVDSGRYQQGRTVAVGGPESPALLRERADLVLEDQAQVVALLRDLVV